MTLENFDELLRRLQGALHSAENRHRSAYENASDSDDWEVIKRESTIIPNIIKWKKNLEALLSEAPLTGIVSNEDLGILLSSASNDAEFHDSKNVTPSDSSEILPPSPKLDELMLTFDDNVSLFSTVFTQLDSQQILYDAKPDIAQHSYEAKRQSKASAALLLLIDKHRDMIQAGAHIVFDIVVDSWFCDCLFIHKLVDRGLQVTGRLQNNTTLYRYRQDSKNSLLTLKQLYEKLSQIPPSILRRQQGENADILGCWRKGKVALPFDDGDEAIDVKIVFLKDRSSKDPKAWMAILTTDLNLTEEQVVRMHAKRSKIAEFFKTAQALPQWKRAFPSRSRDMLMNHTALICDSFILSDSEAIETIPTEVSLPDIISDEGLRVPALKTDELHDSISAGPAIPQKPSEILIQPGLQGQVNVILLGEEYETKQDVEDTWQEQLYELVCKMMVLRHPYVMATMDKNTVFNTEWQKSFSYVKSEIKGREKRLPNGLWVEFDKNADELITSCYRLLEICGHSKEELKIERLED